MYEIPVLREGGGESRRRRNILLDRQVSNQDTTLGTKILEKKRNEWIVHLCGRSGPISAAHRPRVHPRRRCRPRLARDVEVGVDHRVVADAAVVVLPPDAHGLALVRQLPPAAPVVVVALKCVFCAKVAFFCRISFFQPGSCPLLPRRSTACSRLGPGWGSCKSTGSPRRKQNENSNNCIFNQLEFALL